MTLPRIPPAEAERYEVVRDWPLRPWRKRTQKVGRHRKSEPHGEREAPEQVE